jgi:hypothetical protein
MIRSVRAADANRIIELPDLAHYEFFNVAVCEPNLGSQYVAYGGD